MAHDGGSIPAPSTIEGYLRINMYMYSPRRILGDNAGYSSLGDRYVILRIKRCFRSLPVHHRITIFITMLLPAFWPPVLAYIARDPVLHGILNGAVFLVWSVIAVVVLASTLKKDRSEAEQLVSQPVEALSGRIGKLEEEHGDLRVDLRQEVDNLEEAVRSTFEQLGVVLPPRRISIRAKAFHISASWSVANVTVVGGSKVARLRKWFRRSMRRLWEVVYGKPEDS